MIDLPRPRATLVGRLFAPDTPMTKILRERHLRCATEPVSPYRSSSSRHPPLLVAALGKIVEFVPEQLRELCAALLDGLDRDEDAFVDHR